MAALTRLRSDRATAWPQGHHRGVSGAPGTPQTPRSAAALEPALSSARPRTMRQMRGSEETEVVWVPHLDHAAQHHVQVYQRWLAISAVAYVVAHHLGVLPHGLGSAPDGTQWADWLQLLVPVIVLAPAAMVTAAADSPPKRWMLFGIGCVVYAMGQGIHLAANSVNNARPGQTAHLWDEIVGHLIWYIGTALVLLALARTMPNRPRCGPIGYILALAVGLTWASNAVGGHTEVLSLAVAIVAAWFGWRHRRELGETLFVGFLPSAVLLVVVLTPRA